MPRRRRLLQRVHNLGSGRSAPHVWEAGAVPGDELLLPVRGVGARARLVLCTKVSGEEVDQLHQRPTHSLRNNGDAFSQSCERHILVRSGTLLQPLRVPEVQGVVGTAQLHSVGWLGRRGGVHGDVVLLRLAVS